MSNVFTKHPHSVGKTYFEHAVFAVKISIMFFLLCVVCLVHALFPFLFTNTASNMVLKLNQKFERMNRSGGH